MTLTRLLVANRGEIARRIIRTAHEMGIACVAVFAGADEDAPFVSEADESLRLPGSYLDAAAILAAAAATGADAVHPGYGFLSENAGFAHEVVAAGLTWVGPPPAVIAAMGDKLAAKRLAVAEGVPTLPCADDPDDPEAVGYPLLVKATAGGGGRGMRVVERAADLGEAVASARREAGASFGDDRVFLETYVSSARHVEIQVLGDRHGGLVHLGERECSIQRRHQKLLEESPSPALDPPLRQTMVEAALRLARAIGYESAGTVEFILDDASRKFFFLEMNTRLQVEHPVTEEVTGIDLVGEQLRIAAGEPLGYEQADVEFAGHAIEVRLCAEDPSAGFLPAAGTMAAFAPAPTPSVRWESSVEEGSVVGVAFDSMLAKVIAHARSRAEAASRLALALERLHIGGVKTNRDFLAGVLRHEEFLIGATTTGFIDRVQPSRQLVLDEPDLQHAGVAAALWIEGENRREAAVLDTIPSGWRNSRMPPERVSLRFRERVLEISYRRQRDGSLLLGDGSKALVHRRLARAVDVEVNGRRALVRVTRANDFLYVQVVRGTIELRVLPRFEEPTAELVTGGLQAPMPGAVVDVRVAVGERVAAGTTVVVIEAMKMEHHITAPTDGVVTQVFVAAGQHIGTATDLVVIEPDEPEPDEPEPGGEAADDLAAAVTGQPDAAEGAK